MTLFSLVYRSLRKVLNLFYRLICLIITIIKLKGNGVHVGNNFSTSGIPLLNVWRNGKMKIGNNFRMHNNGSENLIGRQQACIFVVADNAELIIGNNVGISATAIVCFVKIVIGNNVKMGGNIVIYDTDFHSLNALDRINSELDKLNIKSSPVKIEDNVFIGSHSTILKGVTIGKNSIVGACSVVTKNIPENEIWAGNPAKMIRKIS